MAVYKIPCGIIARFANALNKYNHMKKDREHLDCFCVENYKNSTYVVATNAKIMAIQRVAFTDEPDSQTLIRNDAEFVNQCVKESEYGSELTIVDNEMLNFVSIASSFGYQTKTDMKLRTQELFWQGWRGIIPKQQPTESKGFLFVDAEMLGWLVACAPSGRVTFPKIINDDHFVLLRDPYDIDFLGIIHLSNSQTEPRTKLYPATLPDWKF